MKMLVRIVFGLLAIVGGFVIALIAARSFIPDGVMWSSEGRICSRDLLARQVSPEGARAAEHVRLTCDDGTIEHRLLVGPARMQRGEPAEGAVSIARQHPATDAFAGAILPLRLWWESDLRLIVRYQHGLDFTVDTLGPIAVQASPYQSRKSQPVAQPTAWSPGASARAHPLR